MDENHCRSSVQFKPERIELGLAQVAAINIGHEHDAVGTERVQGVLRLVERRIHIGQRDTGEHTHPVRAFLHQFCAKLIDRPGKCASLAVVPEVNSGRGDGQDPRCDVLSVHPRYRAVGGPGGDSGSA
jgi:hypothetical protein